MSLNCWMTSLDVHEVAVVWKQDIAAGRPRSPSRRSGLTHNMVAKVGFVDLCTLEIGARNY